MKNKAHRKHHENMMVERGYGLISQLTRILDDECKNIGEPLLTSNQLPGAKRTKTTTTEMSYACFEVVSLLWSGKEPFDLIDKIKLNLLA